MKKTIYNLFLCLILLPFVSCESEDIGQHFKNKDSITLKLYTGTPVSRAMEDKLHEYALSHLDVFIFRDATDDSNSSGSTDDEKEKVHYERIRTNVSPEGEVTLTGKGRNEFTSGASYWVYVIANSQSSTDIMSDITSLDDLKKMTQEDPFLHLTATSALNAPQYFLMDGIAFLNGGTPGAVVLNDGIAANTTELNVNLSRAAAKVVVELTPGDNVTFKQNKEEGYYLRNLPTVTTLLAEASLGDGLQKLVTTTKSVSAYSEYTTEKVTITAYVYAHSWSQNEFFTKGTSLVLNIPLTYDADPSDNIEATVHDNSYYQIELGKGRKFERNNYYLITGVINAPGATEDAQLVTLDNLNYQVLDWTVQALNVGGEEKPVYLKVNKDTLRIYNQEIDESLVFSSSSPITSITIHDAVTGEGTGMSGTGNPYFYNKFGVKTSLTSSKNNYTEKIDDNTSSNVIISANADAGLSGNIKVNSTIPKNNTIRYFTMLITNGDGLKEVVVVEQYPVIYITNVLGWYSYRSDFNATYENANNRYISHADWKNNSWSLGTGKVNSAFFRSKVNKSIDTSTGKSNLYYYYWANSDKKLNEDSYKSAQNGGNARMYHVHVTATSSEYTIGRPRLDANGYPVNDADNARLVSPSFFIASQLGATTNPSSYTQAVTHCANYVETVAYDKNGTPVVGNKNGNNIVKVVHLDDWRLPTAAEVEIIMKHQYGVQGKTPTVAMDEVLAGENYYCVNPNGNNIVNNPQNGNSGTFVRCVRDAY